MSSEAAAACKPWRCSTPCGSQQQQQQRVAASLQTAADAHHQQHQSALSAGLYSAGVPSLGSQAPSMSDYAAVAGGLLDSKPTIIAASMF